MTDEEKKRIFGGVGFDSASGIAVDFHTHILPKMDDGAKNIGVCLLLIKRAVLQGASCIVLTPHFYAVNENPDNFITRRSEAFLNLRKYVRTKFPLIMMGAEVQYFEGITGMEMLTELRIGESPLLLLELPFKKWGKRVIDDVLELNSRPDCQVVIAHFERYIEKQPPGTLEYLRQKGVLIQANAEYFLQKKTQKKALQHFEDGNIDFIGSDCHNLDTRNVNIGYAYQLIEDEFGHQVVAKMSKKALLMLHHRQKLHPDDL